MCILRDLNGWIGDRTKVGITSAFGVPGENDNGRRVVEFCEEKGVYVGNIYFKHRSVYKYTRVAEGEGDVETKSMIDLVLVKRNMLRYVQNERAVRGMGCGFSDHYVVLCKVRLVRAWIKRREVVVGTRKIGSKKLREHQYRNGYARSLEGKGVEWEKPVYGGTTR